MAKAKKTSISTAGLGASQDFEIDGHDFTVDYDDAHKLHAFLVAREDAVARIQAFEERGDADGLESVKLYAEVSAVLKTAVDDLLGDGSWALLFGDEEPVFRALALVTALANEIGPAYDKMFEAYKTVH